MNFDMRIYVERRQDGRWSYAFPPDVAPFQPDDGWLDGPVPSDWYLARHLSNPDSINVMTGAYGRSDDGIVSVNAHTTEPECMSEEMRRALHFATDGFGWLLLSELKQYNFDCLVSKVVQRFSAADLAEQNQRSGRQEPDMLYADVQSHRWQSWKACGYEEADMPLRSCVPDLLALIELIEQQAGVGPEDIRLVFWALG